MIMDREVEKDLNNVTANKKAVDDKSHFFAVIE